VDGHPEYEVESILKVRRKGRGLQYLVHWKGYSHEEDTWEPKRNVEETKAWEEFYKENPKAPHR
jgi:hypothetical protein